jgi:hypothetical protein
VRYKRSMRSRRILVALVIVVGSAVLLRLALPTIVVWYVNRTLDRIPGYDASIERVELSLIRGAYVIRGARLDKIGGRVPLPLFSARVTYLSVEWEALMEGKLVGKIELEDGSLNFVNGRTQEDKQLSVNTEWLEVIKGLFPLRFNRFGIKNFEIRYRDPHSSPPVDVTISKVRAEGRNFSNTRRSTEALNATVQGLGLIEQHAPLVVNAVVAPSHTKPTFKLNASLEKLPLKLLNDLFKAYGSFDVERGSGDFYLWIEADHGYIKGTLKPLLHDVEILNPERDTESLLSTLWESLVAAAADVFENKSSKQIGSVIPFEGSEADIKENMWAAIVELVRNAFFKALKPGLSEGEKER